MSKKLLLLVSLCSLGFIEARWFMQSKEENLCGNNQKACYEDPNCRCYCSVQCGPRKKRADDKPVFVKNDPAGHYCYCQIRDYKKYYENHCDKVEYEKSKRR